MSAPPALTIALPTLRRPALLAETLRSLLAQTEASLEILVSDNGSGDETPEVVARHPDPRVRFRRNPATVPMVEHWNQILAEARGDLFTLVSDDDLVDPGFAAALIRVLRADPRVALVLTRSELIDRQGKALRQLPAPGRELREGPEFLEDWLCQDALLPVPTMVSTGTRTALLRRLGGYPAFTDGLHADNACAVALALHGRVAYAGDALLRYRVYPESANRAAPWTRLAEASGQAKAWLASNAAVAERLAGLEPAVRRTLTRGFERFLRREYQQRLLTQYLPALGIRETLRAAYAYPRDRGYSLSLPRFTARVLRKGLVRRLRG
ncbi:MAG: glycosyltransferase family 2 protein [Deltaproteobacteria bacterium]|nr:glycosyltransferase family 2 protein [Deltaproteobacteria bacterium]